MHYSSLYFNFNQFFYKKKRNEKNFDDGGMRNNKQSDDQLCVVRKREGSGNLSVNLANFKPISENNEKIT